MTGSVNERFLLRSVRGDMPNSINNEIKPQELIHRRINNHESRIKGKNKNKSIYSVGTRVRLQNSKTKLFDTNGIIVEPRWTDNSEVVSYIIRTDSGLVTSRHLPLPNQQNQCAQQADQPQTPLDTLLNKEKNNFRTKLLNGTFSTTT